MRQASKRPKESFAIDAAMTTADMPNDCENRRRAADDGESLVSVLVRLFL